MRSLLTRRLWGAARYRGLRPHARNSPPRADWHPWRPSRPSHVGRTAWGCRSPPTPPKAGTRRDSRSAEFLTVGRRHFSSTLAGPHGGCLCKVCRRVCCGAYPRWAVRVTLSGRMAPRRRIVTPLVGASARCAARRPDEGAPLQNGRAKEGGVYAGTTARSARDRGDANGSPHRSASAPSVGGRGGPSGVSAVHLSAVPLPFVYQTLAVPFSYTTQAFFYLPSAFIHKAARPPQPLCQQRWLSL